jgi:hypothetical protein
MTKRTRYFLVGSASFLAAGLTVGLAAYYGGIPGFAQPAGPEELSYVPANAVVVAYANVRQLMDSAFRQQVKSLEPADKTEGQAEFKDATGINIETDVDYVLACVLPLTSSSGDQTGFVIARGRFDRHRIEALVQQKGGVAQDYKGHRLFVHTPDVADLSNVPVPGKGTVAVPMPKHPTTMGLTFVTPQVVAVGTPDAIERIIDLSTGAPTVRSNSELMKMIESVSAGNAWAVGRFDVLSQQAHLSDQVSAQLPPITWVKAMGHVNGGISGMVSVEARDQAAADNLRQVVNGFIALARLQAGSKPELTSVLQSIQVTGDGTTVGVSFAVPAAAIEALKAGMSAPHRTPR